MLQTNLGIPIKEKDGKITDLLFAMKKRGFGAGWWNGVGGKVGVGEGAVPGETIEEALHREAKDELNIEIGEIEKVAEIKFKFPHQKDWDQIMHVYFVRSFQGEPEESEEMRPQWFKIEDVPWDKMWPGDIYWMKPVFEGKKVKGNFVFEENHKLVSHVVEEVSAL